MLGIIMTKTFTPLYFGASEKLIGDLTDEAKQLGMTRSLYIRLIIDNRSEKTLKLPKINFNSAT